MIACFISAHTHVLCDDILLLLLHSNQEGKVKEWGRERENDLQFNFEQNERTSGPIFGTYMHIAIISHTHTHMHIRTLSLYRARA